MIFAPDDEYRAVLDACVLAPMPLCDTLLRCAEEPSLYLVYWSEQTLDEVDRTLQKFGYSEVQAARRIRHMREAFPESTVSISTNLIQSVEGMPDPEDRHVAAVAIHLRAQVVVTANLRHFPQQVFARHHIAVRSPDDFLVGQFHRNPQRILEVLSAQASATRQTLVEIQKKLLDGLPNFAELIQTDAQKARPL